MPTCEMAVVYSGAVAPITAARITPIISVRSDCHRARNRRTASLKNHVIVQDKLSSGCFCTVYPSVLVRGFMVYYA
jgi:hypothetical protein